MNDIRTLKLIEIRYDDELVRTSEGWRIFSRTLVNTVSNPYFKDVRTTY